MDVLSEAERVNNFEPAHKRNDKNSLQKRRIFNIPVPHNRTSLGDTRFHNERTPWPENCTAVCISALSCASSPVKSAQKRCLNEKSHLKHSNTLGRCLNISIGSSILLYSCLIHIILPLTGGMLRGSSGDCRSSLYRSRSCSISRSNISIASKYLSSRCKHSKLSFSNLKCTQFENPSLYPIINTDTF